MFRLVITKYVRLKASLARNSKERRRNKTHPPVQMKAVLFNRPHPEYEHGYTKPKCTFLIRDLFKTMKLLSIGTKTMR